MLMGRVPRTLDQVAAFIRDKSIPEPNSGCTLWEGCFSTNKEKGLGALYGHVRFNKRMVKVHRLAYEAVHGPLAPGMHVLHRCDVMLCTNPAHLRAGTNDENHADKARKDRGKKRLTADKAREIHSLVKSGVLQHEAARRFNVQQSTVSRIMSGKRRSAALSAAI